MASQRKVTRSTSKKATKKTARKTPSRKPKTAAARPKPAPQKTAPARTAVSKSKIATPEMVARKIVRVTTGDPNAVKRFVGGAIQLWSRCEIDGGTEITHDYLINTHEGSRWACNCGASRCRGEAVPSFFDLPISIQLEYREYLAPWFIAHHPERVASLNHAARRSTPERS